MQLRTDGANRRESAGTGQVVLKVVPVTCAALSGSSMHQLMRVSFPTRTAGTGDCAIQTDNSGGDARVALKETTAVQQVSHRPIKRQSRSWSQRGTKVNGSHHGDSPLLRPTGIQVATKSYATLQAMAPTNSKTVHQISLLNIESNLDRLGLLSPTHDQRSQQQR